MGGLPRLSVSPSPPVGPCLSQPRCSLVLTPDPKGLVTEVPVWLASGLRNLHALIHEVVFKDNVNYAPRSGELFFF